MGVLVIGGRDLGRFVRLSFAYVSLEAEMLIASLINKLCLYKFWGTSFLGCSNLIYNIVKLFTREFCF